MNSSENPRISSFSIGDNREKKYFGFTPRQLRFLLAYGLYNVFRGATVLIIGPLYPPEADKREITTSVVGFVIGAFDFATFLSSLFYGKHFIPKHGPHKVIIFSAFNTTICTALFGCLGFVEDRDLFLTLSFTLRLIGGAGDAGFYPSAFTVFAYEFPDLVSTTIGLFELFFGVGSIVGPIACGQLVDMVGFEWTYVSVAACLLLSAILILLMVPTPKRDKIFEVGTPRNISSLRGLFALFKVPEIYFAVFSLFSTAVSIGFLTATLEAHLDQFSLSSIQVGAVFSVSTIIYTVASPIWGQLSDKLGFDRALIIASGSVIIAAGFVVLGPLEFISEENVLWATLVGLGLHGVGIGAAVMIFFPFASESAIARGFSDSTPTYGLVSSVFTLTFSLGNSCGPAVSGVLYDAVGFKDATFAVIGLCSTVVVSAGVLRVCCRKSTPDPDSTKAECVA